jgi:integrase
VTGNVRKRGHSWQARWYDGTGKQRTKTFATKRQATDHLARMIADRSRGDYLDPQRAQTKLSVVAADWLQLKRLTIRPKTVEGYEGNLKVHVLPSLGDRPVGSITTADVRRWIAQRSLVVKPNTVRNAYRLLNAILSHAVEDQLIRYNPCAPLRRGSLPTPANNPMKVLTVEQVELVAAQCDSIVATFIRFAAYTGMRAGEISALRMRNVDLLRGRVLVRESLCRVKSQTLFTEPKTRHSIRTVTLPQSLVADVRAYLDNHPLGQPGPDDLLFCEADGSPILHWRRYSAFKRALIAAGIDPTVRLHDLRHTCASLLIAQGVDAKVIQVHLGPMPFR